MFSSKNTQNRFAMLIIGLFIVLAVLFLGSLAIGRYSMLSPVTVVQILVNRFAKIFPVTWTGLEENVVFYLRMPRIISSIIVGASLALSGVAFQAIFANPMASPDTLGVSSGASLGACFGILVGFSHVMIEFSSFILGCITVMISYFIAMTISRGKNSTVFLVLTGMVVSAFLSSMISVVTYLADPANQLPAITYWLMGSFSSIDELDVQINVTLFLLGATPLFLLRWKMNTLSLNYFEAKSMGINITLLRAVTIVCATLLTASAVAVSGGIGWVGLVIPHMARFIVGNDCRKLVPVSCLAGGIYLLAMDNLARTISGSEIPIGILTSLIGAPVFFLILIVNREKMLNEN